jgi:hypothetical protein
MSSFLRLTVLTALALATLLASYFAAAFLEESASSYSPPPDACRAALRRVMAKERVVKAVYEGRLSPEEVAARFRAIDRAEGGPLPPPGPGESEEHFYQRQARSWLCAEETIRRRQVPSASLLALLHS